MYQTIIAICFVAFGIIALATFCVSEFVTDLNKVTKKNN